MAPLIRNIPRKDVQWAKFKSSYMWNKTYYLRRTKFVVYQIATTLVNVVNGIGISLLKDYNELQGKDIPGFPDARIETKDFVGSFAFNIFSCLFIALFFGAALFFDLFWPEREEARRMQWIWKLGAAASSIFQLAASLAITIVVTTQAVHIRGVSVEQENIIHRNWDGPPLEYHKDKLALVAVAFCWIEVLFTLWSTIVMWRCYVHNSKHGPFADHGRKGGGGETGETLSMETGVTHV